MIISAISTQKITKKDTSLLAILDNYLPTLHEKMIVAITSKIVSICEGRIIPFKNAEKKKLIFQESQYYLPPQESKYNITLTIKRNLLIPTAGIDESNGNGYYILWPKNPEKTADKVRAHLRKKFRLTHIGIIITDSKTTPLRWGTTGCCLAHSGFRTLNNYIGKPDIFGRPLHVTKANIVDALASSAVVVMGEGSEQTPLAVISDIASFVHFQKGNPTALERRNFRIPIDDDLYAPILRAVKWKKGKAA